MTTAANPASRAPKAWLSRRRPTIRGLRLATGLVLFAYILSHFVNHALGNISLAAMEAGLDWIAPFWGLPGIHGLLYGSILVHGALGLWALYARPRLDFRPAELAQLALGLAVVPLIAVHVVGTALAHELYGTSQGYAQLLHILWVASPIDGIRQSVALLVAWGHGCLGLHFWLRLKPSYPALAPWLLCAAVLVPVLALLGFAQGGRAVAELARDPEWRIENLPAEPRVEPGRMPAAERLAQAHRLILAATGGGVALALLARVGRRARERGRGLVRLTYPGGAVARVPKGLTVLEASRVVGIPHASVCGGRGRCSTCRVRIGGPHVVDLPAASAAEQAVLDRIGAGHGVRLACQVRAACDLTVTPLLPPQTGARQARRPASPASFGEERFVVAMFVDMRGSTRLAERRLPFDTVFVINRFLEAVGSGVAEAGGSPNQFLGDGMMALFGIEAEPGEASRQALRAVGLIGRNVARLNEHFAASLDEPIRFGIGLHAGTAILGEIGDRERGRTVFTAIGDPVNVASRLQGMTKHLGCEALVAEAVYVAAGMSPEGEAADVAIEGRDGGARAYPIRQARDLLREPETVS